RRAAGARLAQALRGQVVSRPVRDELLVFGQPHLDDDVIADVVDALRSGWLGRGPRVERFEAVFRDYTGARHVRALNSCSAGLFLALSVAGIGPGDEVVTTPLTFAATIHAVEHVGATPVLADIDPTTLNLDPRCVAAAITPRTRAILPVHFAGRPCEMDALGELARTHDLVVVEDAAHALGAEYHGRRVGVLSDFTVFSFQAGKNVTTADGGMVTTDRSEWADRIGTLSLHGMSDDAWGSFRTPGAPPLAVAAGFKLAMTDVAAAIGTRQLVTLDAAQARRQEIWERYDRELTALPLAPPPAPAVGTVHGRHLYTVVLDLDAIGAPRDAIRAALREQGIGTGVHYVPIHLHPYYRERLGLAVGALPNAERVGERILSLPLAAHLTDDDVSDVVTALLRVL
ncbi:MAG TPA: DegT/DnrJ/EryC1/StrS family aminotransferase, partial [Acidimicrobiia bacterium]|nr:DegT/DnrJ/EryC1/StrS family aminotransferase [Acidimicrobiia bacterium]